MTALGAVIQQERKRIGYSSAEAFSHEFGFSRNSERAWESGSDMKVSNLLKISKALNLSLSEIISRTEKVMLSEDLIIENLIEPNKK